MHISVIAIAGALGVELLTKGEAAPAVELDAPEGPSIADIAAMITAPRGGGDTLNASAAALGLLNGG